MAATGLPGLWVMAGSSRAASAGRGRALPVINRTRLPPLPPLPPLSKMISIYYTRRKDTEKIQQNASKIAKICCFLAPQGTYGANVGCGLFQYPRKSRKYVPYFPRKFPNFEVFSGRARFFQKGTKIRWLFEGSGSFASLGRSSRERAAILRRGGANGGHQSQPPKPASGTSGTSVTSTI